MPVQLTPFRRELAGHSRGKEQDMRYVRALDTADPDAYAVVFTADGEFGSGPGATKGSAALRKMVAARCIT